MFKGPCYNCPDKKPACSTKCNKPEYIEDRLRRERIKENKCKDNLIRTTVIEGMRRSKRKGE